MPFFSGKFSPKKTTPRRQAKSESDVSALATAISTSTFEADIKDSKDATDLDDELTITLGENVIHFDNGEWIPENGPIGGSYKENIKLKRRINELEEENNMLRVKYEVMLDMLTKTTADFHLQTKEIEELRALSKKTPKYLEIVDKVQHSTH